MKRITAGRPQFTLLTPTAVAAGENTPFWVSQDLRAPGLAARWEEAEPQNQLGLVWAEAGPGAGRDSGSGSTPALSGLHNLAGRPRGSRRTSWPARDNRPRRPSLWSLGSGGASADSPRFRLLRHPWGVYIPSKLAPCIVHPESDKDKPLHPICPETPNPHYPSVPLKPTVPKSPDFTRPRPDPFQTPTQPPIFPSCTPRTQAASPSSPRHPQAPLLHATRSPIFSSSSPSPQDRARGGPRPTRAPGAAPTPGPTSQAAPAWPRDPVCSRQTLVSRQQAPPGPWGARPPPS